MLEDVLKDHRHNFGYDRANTLGLYNWVRGELETLSSVTVQVKDHISDPIRPVVHSPGCQFGQDRSLRARRQLGQLLVDVMPLFQFGLQF